MAVVTGASAGIGAALVNRLHQEGYRTVGLSLHHAEETDLSVVCDLAGPEGWDRASSTITDTVGHLSPGTSCLFVHAAGVVDPLGLAGQVSAKQLRRAWLLNAVAGPLLGDHFISTVHGHFGVRQVLMLTSVAATQVTSGWSAYGPPKAAVEHWVRHAGVEQGRDGVDVMAVRTGVVAIDGPATGVRGEPVTVPEAHAKKGLYLEGKLLTVETAADRIWRVLAMHRRDRENGAILDAREVTDTDLCPYHGR